MMKKLKVEPSSSIMGIFTILEKNEFYHNTAPNLGFLHTTADEVLQDFENLHKNRNRNTTTTSRP